MTPKRKLIIPDVHGCLLTLKALLKKVNFNAQNDQLFFLGDLVNKGPDSIGVIEFVDRLQQEHPTKVHTLLGNHDFSWLEALEKNKLEALIQIESLNPKIDFKSIPFQKKVEYIRFFNRMKCYIELENTFLVHAGFNTEISDVFEDRDAMINIREFTYSPQVFNNKRIIRGHIPTPLEEIKLQINDKSKILSLDNGCVSKDITGLGNLLCFELHAESLWVQPNMEKF